MLAPPSLPGVGRPPHAAEQTLPAHRPSLLQALTAHTPGVSVRWSPEQASESFGRSFGDQVT